MYEKMAEYASTPGKVVSLDSLVPIVAKSNVAGEFTKVKARFVVADTVAKGRLEDVYAPSVQQDTVRKQVNLELQLNGFTIVVDAANAYHHGTPCDPRSPNGRFIYARLPKGFELLDLDHTRYAAGMKTLLGIPGNVPGLQNA
jgi:hypothetical protein